MYKKLHFHINMHALVAQGSKQKRGGGGLKACLKENLQTGKNISELSIIYNLITLVRTKFNNLLSEREKAMFSKCIRYYNFHINLHALVAQGSKQKSKAYILHSLTCLASRIVMEIYCNITGFSEPPISPSLFSIILFS